MIVIAVSLLFTACEKKNTDDATRMLDNLKSADATKRGSVIPVSDSCPNIYQLAFNIFRSIFSSLRLA